MTTENEIISKIRKLFAVARDSGATEGEAANAMALAQRLMLQYGISQVPSDDNEGTKLKWGDTIVDLDEKWHEVVASSVAYLYGTKMVYRGSEGFCFVGRVDLIDACTLTTNFIADQIELLYKDALPKGMSKSDRAQYRKDFKRSCAIRVSDRVQDLVKEMQQETKALEYTGSTALVVQEHRLTLKNEVDAFLEGQLKKSRKMPVKVNSLGKGAQDGYKSGAKVHINKAVGN